jgi:hypothetical protein
VLPAGAEKMLSATAVQRIKGFMMWSPSLKVVVVVERV